MIAEGTVEENGLDVNSSIDTGYAPSNMNTDDLFCDDHGYTEGSFGDPSARCCSNSLPGRSSEENDSAANNVISEVVGASAFKPSSV